MQRRLFARSLGAWICFQDQAVIIVLLLMRGSLNFQEPVLHRKAAMGKIISRRSLQMFTEQQTWQESQQGMKILEFHWKLPAYNEKDAISSTIAPKKKKTQVLQHPKPSLMVVAVPSTMGSGTDSGPVGDHSESQLQTLLARAGCAAPIYTTKQEKNNQFQAIIEQNRVQIMGNPLTIRNKQKKMQQLSLLSGCWKDAREVMILLNRCLCFSERARKVRD